MNKIFSSVLVTLLISITSATAPPSFEEIYRKVINAPSTADTSRVYGFKTESYEIITRDGYFISLHRIQNSSVLVSEPFLLVHGLGSTSAQYTLLGKQNSLAYVLANAGYDVWLVDLRGSTKTLKHQFLSKDTSEFWDYGLHEQAVFDLPASIDYILSRTNYKQLYYVGHSMGGTLFFMMASTLPDYNAKIKHAFLMSPVCYLTKSTSAAAAFLTTKYLQFYRRIGPAAKNHVPLENRSIQILKMLICSRILDNCIAFMERFSGKDPIVERDHLYDTIFVYAGAVTIRQVLHYGQFYNNPDTFRQIDFGDLNLLKYNSTIPPDYPIGNILSPITIMYSVNDPYASTENMEKLSGKLKNAELYRVPYDKFNHLDFVVLSYAKKLVYMPLLNRAESYKKNLR